MALKVVVTGASSGIGRATALMLSKDGHEVFATARNDSKLTETVRMAEAAGGATVHKGLGDVRVEADVQRNYADAIQAMGDIDVVVLNAGLGWPNVLEKFSAADFDEIFNTNVRGVFLWLKEVLPAMKKKRSGQIIIVNSINGQECPGPLLSLYTASKFAVTGLTIALREELKGSGVKAGAVYPGATTTGIWFLPQASITGINEEETRTFYGLDKALHADEVAQAILTFAYQGPRSDIDKIVIRPYV